MAKPSALTIFVRNEQVPIDRQSVQTAAVVCGLWFAVAAIILCWPSRRPVAERRWEPKTRRRLGLACSFGGSAVSLLHQVQRLPAPIEQVVHHLAAAPLVGRVLLAQDRDRLAKMAVAIDVLVTTAVPMLLGKSMPAVLNSATMAYGLAQARAPRRATRIATVMAFLIGVLHPVKEIVRRRLFGREPFYRRGERPARYRHDATGALVDARGWIPRWFARTDRFVDLAYVVSQTPSVVPFLGWRRYLQLPLGLIPRMLWPTKPVEASGQEYGHRYGFLEPDDTEHSVTMPVIVEAWATAGWAGVVCSAILWAGLLRALWARGIGDSSTPGAVMRGMALVGVVVNAENTLSLSWAGAVARYLLYDRLAAVMGQDQPFPSE